jgi:phosphotransferase system enzyme I (PtsI)
MDSVRTERQEKFKGIPISPGIEMGRVSVHLPPSKGPIQRRSTKTEAEELALFQYAKEQIEKDVQKARETVAPSLVHIIEIQLMIVRDPAFNEEVRELVEEKRATAEYAINRVLSRMALEIEKKGSDYMRERALEMRQLSSDMILKLRGREGKVALEPDTILVAEDMSIQEIIRAVRSGAKAVALGSGGRTSHAAIVLRNSNIPAVFGLKGVTDRVEQGDQVALDGAKGVFILHPTVATKSAMTKAREEFERFTRELLKIRGERTVTKDGIQVHLLANLDFPEELGILKRYGEFGIGLFRTELLFYSNRTDEASQEEMYREMAAAVHPEPFVVRVFDVGGDKMMDITERNPFLGTRGIRALLAERTSFRIQLRAILRANTLGNIQIMIPMVSDIDEVRTSKDILLNTLEEVRAEGRQDLKIPPFGVMVETPAAACMADRMSKYVDFMSIGTNDLTQFTLAVDRRNPRLSYLFDHLHPSVLSLISQVERATRGTDTRLSICGELASDPFGVPLILALGIDTLSLNPAFLLEMKELIRRISIEEVRPYLKKALRAETSKEVREIMGELIYARYPDILRFLI